jgi:heat shock protein HslJ
MAQMSSRRALALACLASGLITAACASSAPPAESSDLAGTDWTVQSIDGQPTQTRAPSVQFAAEDRISGSASCNRFFGVYEAAGGAIDVRALGHTEMACETPLMTQEAAFLGVLDDAERYQRRGDRLVITADDGRNIVLAPMSG